MSAQAGEPMSVKARRARRGKGHEPISRDMLQDTHLTVKARGILSIMVSLPDEWEVGGVEGFCRQFCDRDGFHAINEGIKADAQAAGQRPAPAVSGFSQHGGGGNARARAAGPRGAHGRGGAR